MSDNSEFFKSLIENSIKYLFDSIVSFGKMLLQDPKFVAIIIGAVLGSILTLFIYKFKYWKSRLEGYSKKESRKRAEFLSDLFEFIGTFFDIFHKK